MSSLLFSKKVTIYIGDGFKFLAENESTYDVIITDSPDPVGSAESLFQKPYFQLLYYALTPGGHISTQGECIWIRLLFICYLKQIAAELFPVAEYTYTNIPTYPSGQGFAVCSKERGRNIKTPLKGRNSGWCRYYNGQIHMPAFVLPEFCKAILEEWRNILSVFERDGPIVT